MHRYFYIFLLAFLVLSHAHFTWAKTKTYEGRTYEIVLPDGPTDSPRPTLFALHGGGGTGVRLLKHFNLETWAQKDGVVLIYPSGNQGHWNDGRTGGKDIFKGGAPDDVAYLSALANHLTQAGISDKSQIYVIGVSNGGMMTQRLMCDASTIFAGGVAIIAGLPQSLNDCAPDIPRSMLLINGDNDPLMPWNGGGVGFRKGRGLVLSGPDSFAYWQNVNGCKGTTKTTNMANRNKNDHTRAVLSRAAGCANGNQVELIRIIGGGHNIPAPTSRKLRPASRKYKRRAKLLGLYNHDFDARDKVWDFFGFAQK